MSKHIPTTTTVERTWTLGGFTVHGQDPCTDFSDSLRSGQPGFKLSRNVYPNQAIWAISLDELTDLIDLLTAVRDKGMK